MGTCGAGCVNTQLTTAEPTRGQEWHRSPQPRPCRPPAPPRHTAAPGNMPVLRAHGVVARGWARPARAAQVGPNLLYDRFVEFHTPCLPFFFCPAVFFFARARGSRGVQRTPQPPARALRRAWPRARAPRPDPWCDRLSRGAAPGGFGRPFLALRAKDLANVYLSALYGPRASAPGTLPAGGEPREPPWRRATTRNRTITCSRSRSRAGPTTRSRPGPARRPRNPPGAASSWGPAQTPRRARHPRSCSSRCVPPHPRSCPSPFGLYAAPAKKTRVAFARARVGAAGSPPGLARRGTAGRCAQGMYASHGWSGEGHPGHAAHPHVMYRGYEGHAPPGQMMMTQPPPGQR